MKSLFETLATLTTGAVLLAGCGGAPVSATEVPAVTEAKPSASAAAAPVENSTAGATAGAQTTQAPAAGGTAAAVSGAPATSANATTGAAPVKKKTGKTAGAKKTGEQGSCGAGTCG